MKYLQNYATKSTPYDQQSTYDDTNSLDDEFDSIENGNDADVDECADADDDDSGDSNDDVVIDDIFSIKTQLILASKK